jgi:NAD(P)-dependent dehydrogenase (short-subunit alcohol dehydrogenase family)
MTLELESYRSNSSPVFVHAPLTLPVETGNARRFPIGAGLVGPARLERIINVTSLVTRGLAFRSSYAAAKAALESLTRTMAIELAADGITANAIAPGPTETEMFRANNPRGNEGEAAI